MVRVRRKSHDLSMASFGDGGNGVREPREAERGSTRVGLVTLMPAARGFVGELLGLHAAGQFTDMERVARCIDAHVSGAPPCSTNCSACAARPIAPRGGARPITSRRSDQADDAQLLGESRAVSAQLEVPIAAKPSLRRSLAFLARARRNARRAWRRALRLRRRGRRPKPCGRRLRSIEVILAPGSIWRARCSKAALADPETPRPSGDHVIRVSAGLCVPSRHSVGAGRYDQCAPRAASRPRALTECR